MVRIMRKLLVLSMFLFSLLGLHANEPSYDSVMAKVSKEAMVLEFGASTCKACKDMKEVIGELKKDNPILPVYIVDIRENREAIDKFKIQIIPTQVVLDKSGKELSRHIGKLSKEELLSLVELSKK